jgi:hypothetical protein
VPGICGKRLERTKRRERDRLELEELAMSNSLHMWLPKRKVDLSYRVKVNKGKCGMLSKGRNDNTSLNLRLDKIQEALVLALMIVFFVAVFYSNIEFLYKIIVSAMVFSIIFLVGLVNQAIKQKENTYAR